VGLSFVLASRSPRRRDLLGLVVPTERIVVVPPRDASEAGFGGLATRAAIERRLLEIAGVKGADAAGQLASSAADSVGPSPRVIIAADTTIVVNAADGTLKVLGQPPADDSWKDSVRRWFREYYAGRTHLALSALCVIGPGGRRAERIVTTEVTMIADVENHLEWYIGTEEPRGKAGGYAIQGAGSLFISQVTGSLSNVIGLPLEALLEVFNELQIDVTGRA
jgi:septum formation protein